MFRNYRVGKSVCFFFTRPQMEPELGAEIKLVLEEMSGRLEESKITINEPPHFFCSHSDESNCARVVTKRKASDVTAIIVRYEKYLEELNQAVNTHNEKRARIQYLKTELDKLAGIEGVAAAAPAAAAEAPVALPSAPAPVPVTPVAPPAVIQTPAKPVAKPAGGYRGWKV